MDEDTRRKVSPWISVDFPTSVCVCVCVLQNFPTTPWILGARGSVVGWGTALQAGRSRFGFPMRPLDFSVDQTLPTTLWPWVRLSPWQKWVPGIFLGGKGRPAHKAGNFTAICESIV
jgi:hypothetical protein